MVDSNGVPLLSVFRDSRSRSICSHLFLFSSTACNDNLLPLSPLEVRGGVLIRDSGCYGSTETIQTPDKIVHDDAFLKNNPEERQDSFFRDVMKDIALKDYKPESSPIAMSDSSVQTDSFKTKDRTSIPRDPRSRTVPPTSVQRESVESERIFKHRPLSGTKAAQTTKKMTRDRRYLCNQSESSDGATTDGSETSFSSSKFCLGSPKKPSNYGHIVTSPQRRSSTILTRRTSFRSNEDLCLQNRNGSLSKNTKIDAYRFSVSSEPNSPRMSGSFLFNSTVGSTSILEHIETKLNEEEIDLSRMPYTDKVSKRW